MKRIGKLAVATLLVINLVFMGLMLFSAYSPHFNPEDHPIRACFGMVFPVFLFINFCFLIAWLVISYKLAIIPFIAFLLCIPQIGTSFPINFKTKKKNIPPNHIKFLSYNVMGMATKKKVDGKNAILQYIKNSGADIVCMQEYIHTNSKYVTQKDIDTELAMYPHKNIHQVGNKFSGNYIACYSKYPILSAQRLNYESNHNGSVVYNIKIGNDTVTVINNHLESNKLTLEDKKVYEGMLKSPEVDKVKSGAIHLVRKLGEAQALRAPQAKAVAQAVKNSGNKHIVVCGDFNDTPVSYTHRIISNGLVDAFVASGCGLGISYNQNKFYFRIDNILTSKNMKTYNCTVDRSIKDSDHYPIWCYISKK
ncbi:endonuclease/exonuclease/phosphatase family protein [Bacteroides sp. 519]|uniref:endonuclease/exonuclease/phosphatase family protein n=1 Tax=Bacteroides sp. 519 TaxID=2302937 RepID=UPI0013D2882A|nr:endonuclease/exonuclease/phosphatase family protein [Bacteroides sp. 519]NDV57587.1 endonuclease [Bacteroides sp. 519]